MRILNFLANNVFGMLIPPIIMWAIWTGISYLISFIFNLDFSKVYLLIAAPLILILMIVCYAIQKETK